MISVVIPCYNESSVIKMSHDRIYKVMKNNFKEFELIYLDDGSVDNTYSLLVDLKQSCENVRLVKLSRNTGHQNAVCAGLSVAKGDYVVIIDADMQDPPEIIPNMLEEMKKVGAEVIYGKRKKRKGESLFKKLTAKLFYRLLNKLSDVSIPPDAGDFKIITNKVLVSFNKLEERNLYIRGLISWLGFKQVPYEYERDPRLAGETKYTMRKMLKLALNGLLGFSKKPLLLVVQLGFLIIILSFLLFLWILLGYFFSRYILVPGWTSNMVVIIFLGGVQLLSLGIVGLYIGNIFDEVKHRPNFIIEEEK